MVLDAEGQPLEGCLFGAAGMDGSSEYQSLVIYHHNSPSWAETVRLAVPIDKFYGSHVRFEFRHCSSKYLNLRFALFLSFIFCVINWCKNTAA
jgi:dedicator of cytokinesis protein 3